MIRSGDIVKTVQTAAICIFWASKKTKILETQPVCPFREPRWVHHEPIRRLKLIRDIAKEILYKKYKRLTEKYLGGNKIITDSVWSNHWSLLFYFQ